MGRRRAQQTYAKMSVRAEMLQRSGRPPGGQGLVRNSASARGSSDWLSRKMALRRTSGLWWVIVIPREPVGEPIHAVHVRLVQLALRSAVPGADSGNEFAFVHGTPELGGGGYPCDTG